MTPLLFARRVILGTLVALVALTALSMSTADAERWIPLPNQPDSYVSLDVGSIQCMPGDLVNAWIRVKTLDRMGMCSLQRMFGVFRGDTADSLYTVSCRGRQLLVLQAKLCQGVLTVSKRQITNDAGWQYVDDVGPMGKVAYQLYGG